MSSPDSSTETYLKAGETHHVSSVRFTPGTMLAGRYRLVAPLGKGGMGEVYRADDIRLGQPVALKFLPLALASDQYSLDRLRAEVRLGRQISHPNVCRLYDLVEADGHHFVVMEYVDGEDLASLLRRIGRLPHDKAVEIARGLCAGLAAAHDKGVIHRDLKPANVMIDGRGRARIADFGLAAPAGEGRVPGLAGTINYMAPEQLAGQGASTSSDVFALGLVLFEMFTGSRVFDAKSIDALRVLHGEWRPEMLSGSASDIDRGVHRVILRCLARESGDRPVSAQAVLAALPGGDPLQAAVAQGETPSPEMVAAASLVGDLSPLVAWACLVAGLLGLLSIVILADRVTVFRQVPLPRPPEAMADRARDVLARLGYQDANANSAYDFVTDFAFLRGVEKQDSTPGRWETLRNARPGPLLFYYRESPQPLVSTSWIPTPPWEGATRVGVVSLNDPPLDVPGMTRLALDRLGRLTSFVAVPAPFDPESASSFDWSIVLTEAGFDPARLQPAAPLWTPSVSSDRRAAWTGALDGQPEVTFHIEAAANRGRLVSFTMRGPWVQPPTGAASDSTIGGLEASMFVLEYLVVIFGGVWAGRNLRLGRGDRSGARRIAVFTFCGVVLANLSLAAHTALPIVEFSLLTMITGEGLLGAVMIWLQYIALEPTVRRRWPHTLIAWSRLLSGRFRDPLVGRDVLIGVLAGVSVVLVLRLDAAASLFTGGAAPAVADLATPRTPRELAYLLFLVPGLAVLYSVGFLFGICLFQAVVRQVWLARILLFLMFLGVASLLGTDDPFSGLVQGAVLAMIILIVLVRFGLLSCAALMLCYGVLSNVPLTLDWTTWYAGGSVVVLVLFVALMVAAFHTSLAGKPLFGRALIED